MALTSGRSDPAAPAAEPMLVCFGFWLSRPAEQPQAPDPAALQQAISSHLSQQGWCGGEPLRWAITAVDAVRGLRLEGVAVAGGRRAGSADA